MKNRQSLLVILLLTLRLGANLFAQQQPDSDSFRIKEKLAAANSEHSVN